MRVVIIGTGNTATVLGRKILQAGNEIVQVIGRNVESTNQAASLLKATPIYNSRYISADADIYLIAVSDTYISELAGQLKLKNRLLIHTAAAVSKSVLEKSSERFGVLYPLQTLNKTTEELPAIPVLVDGNSNETEKNLLAFAAPWAESVRVADENERLKYHIAAVFANNFSNHLFAITNKYCFDEKLTFKVLYPLIEQTVKAINLKNPASLQTGPAIRKDSPTINKHLQELQKYSAMQNLYRLLSDSISSFSTDLGVGQKLPAAEHLLILITRIPLIFSFFQERI